jgi:hypothetical protein
MPSRQIVVHADFLAWLCGEVDVADRSATALQMFGEPCEGLADLGLGMQIRVIHHQDVTPFARPIFPGDIVKIGQHRDPAERVLALEIPDT